MAGYQIIDKQKMLELMQNQKALVLDCRKTRDYQSGHIDGAMHLHDSLRETLIKGKQYDRPLLIYCYHGHASQHVAEMFADFGFKNVYSLDKGYEGWVTEEAVS